MKNNLRNKLILIFIILFTSFNCFAQKNEDKTNQSTLKLGIILFRDFDQLDVTGPFEIFHEFPNTRIYFISNTIQPVKSTQGIQITPELTFDSAPQMDILFVPGGYGITNVIERNPSLIHFIQRQSPKLKYITSVCTGSLILGYAGELKEYKATSHWLAIKYLDKFGAIPVNKRVVVDRNRITGAGVSAGFDVAMQLGDILFGKTFVENQELLTEYNPKPLYGVTPNTASIEAHEEVIKTMGDTIKSRDLFFDKINSKKKKE